MSIPKNGVLTESIINSYPLCAWESFNGNENPYLKNNPPPGVENEASTNSKLLSFSLSIGNLNEEFSSDIYQYTATVSNNITAITIDAAPEDSKAHVVLSKNQTVVSNPVSFKTANLDVGINTVYIKVKAEDGTSKIYTLYITREDEDEDGSGTGEETPLPTINIGGQDINYIRDELDGYIFKPTKDQFDMLYKQRKDGMYCIDLIGLPADAEGVTFVTDSAWFDRIGHSLLFNAPGIGSIEINDAMFEIIKSGKIITFVLRKGSLQADILIDGESIDWSSYLNPLRITIPYILKAEENVDYIVAYKLGKDGWKNILPDSKYNAKNQEISFTSQTFGHFNVMYNPKAFDDVKQGQWYEKAIGYMSARGIINGVGNNNFEPNTNIKRADFLLMLMRIYGIDADEKAGDNFEDAGSTYYTDMLGTAKQLGIVKGVGGNKFDPEATILRQDMLVMLYRVMDTLDRLPKVPEGGKTVESFSDAGEISDYAYQTLKMFVQSGLIKGNGNRLTPKATTIRAEAAQILFNILNE